MSKIIWKITLQSISLYIFSLFFKNIVSSSSLKLKSTLFTKHICEGVKQKLNDKLNSTKNQKIKYLFFILCY